MRDRITSVTLLLAGTVVLVCARPATSVASPPARVVVCNDCDVEPIEERLHYGARAVHPDAEGRRTLETVALVMRQHPGIRLVLEGHHGRRRDARAISLRRARVALRHLVRLGVARERLRAVGYGATRPLVPDARTASERRRNRRVEFRIDVSGASS